MGASPTCGAPVPDEATGWLECELRGEVATGDHVLVVAEVVEAGVLRAQPLGAGETLTLRETGFRYAG